MDNSYELSYEANSIDTTLMICLYNKNQKLMEKISYIKVPEMSPAGNLEDGFQYVVNKKLIAGSYNVTDSMGKEYKVRLTSEGLVTGLPGINTYYIITDFVADSEDSSDKICFDIQTRGQRCFVFDIDRDTVSLFQDPEIESNTLSTDKARLYKFVKEF